MSFVNNIRQAGATGIDYDDTLDKQKLIDYLEGEIRTYKELGKSFQDRHHELVALYNRVKKGEFDSQ